MYTKTSKHENNIKWEGLTSKGFVMSRLEHQKVRIVTADGCAEAFTISIKNATQSILWVGIPSNRLIEFFQIWPLEQWISSLVGLVLMYWLTTYVYNKRLKFYSIEMTTTFRFWMILSDLLLNLAVGLYYLDYRETVMGALMIKCPIAISPVIFFVELVLVILIKEYVIFTSNKKGMSKS